MPRPPTTKPDLDTGTRISITYLKANGYLEGYKSGVITWYFCGSPAGAVRLAVDTESTNPGMTLFYSAQGRSINHFVPLVQVVSNLGKGFVWMFFCPVAKKRCRILYENGAYFTHREAVQGGMYGCQSIAKRFRGAKRLYTFTQGKKSLAARITKRYWRSTYAGRPTKTFLRWQRDFQRLKQAG